MDESLRTHLGYALETKYDTEYGEDGNGCDCGDYCRCSRIVNLRVTGIDVNSAVESIREHFQIKKKSVDERYGIDRIVRHFKIWDGDKWTICSESGYYGDEIDKSSARFENFDEMMKTLREFLKLKTTTDRINFLLKLEYGYLLPQLKDVSWELVSCSPSQIRMGQREYVKKVSTEDTKIYGDYELPVAVVDGSSNASVSGDGSPIYRLVDGHHRFLANKKQQVSIYLGRKVGK